MIEVTPLAKGGFCAYVPQAPAKGDTTFKYHVAFADPRLAMVSEAIAREYARARQKYAPMHSLHEAYGVIKEEFDEFWDEVKKRKPDIDNVEKELIQLAAMALAAIVDLGPTYKHMPPSQAATILDAMPALRDTFSP